MIDKDKIAADKDRYKQGRGDGAPFFAAAEGEHIIFLCPPIRDASEPYYPVAMHYTGDAGIVCANAEKNPILKDPIFRSVLKGEGKKLPKTCPLCEKGNKPSVKFMMAVLPLQLKGPRDREWGKYDPIEVRPYLAPRSVWNGVADLLLEVGESICDLKGAVFFKIKRSGRKKNDTEYTVMAHMKSLKDPKPLPKKYAAMVLEAAVEDGACDCHKILVRMLKTGDELAAAADGMEVEDEPKEADDLFEDDDAGGEESDDGEEKKTEKKKSSSSSKKKKTKKDDGKKKDKVKKPPCFGIDYDEDDPACEACKMVGECQEKAGGKSKGDEAPEEEEDDTGTDDGGSDDGDEDDDLDSLLD